MKRTICSLFVTAALTFAAKPHPSIAHAFDGDVTSAEKEIVSLAEAMPPEKYDFAPTTGEFTGVRTFALQMRHIAAVNYEVAAAILGEKCPVEMGKNENGVDSLNTKDAIVQFLKESFAYTHKAMLSVTAKNMLAEVSSPFGTNKVTRLSLATVPAWHSFDHYGQAVVYARMNGIIPPASRR